VIVYLSIFPLSISFFLLFSASPAFAYLDPGSGSFFFQLLIAFIVGALYSIKVYWNKIIFFLKRIFSRP